MTILVKRPCIRKTAFDLLDNEKFEKQMFHLIIHICLDYVVM